MPLTRPGRANSDRYIPVSTLTVPPMTSTPSAITSVPRMAFSSPPPLPTVGVVMTLQLKCGTARAMIP